jgi:hypothetical protein
MAALQTLLQPQVLTNVVSQVAEVSDWLSMLFGVQVGGPNIINHGHGRYGAYHIYNNVRKVARGRAPGTAAGRRSAQPMDRVPFVYPRMHDSVALSAEVLHNLGQIADPATRDIAGKDMIKRQTKTLGQLAANWRKAMLVGTLRNSLYMGMDGDDVFFDFVSTSGVEKVLQVPTQMPAGNQAKLNMVGTGDIINASWDNIATDIIGHLGLINAAFQQLCGGHLAACVCGTKVWNNVIQNTSVGKVHGSAHAPFTTLERDALDPAIAKTMKNVYRAKLSVYPDVIWYITDEGLEVGAPGSETFQKIVGDNNVIFVGHEPDDGATACYEGSEPIAEYDNGPEEVKTGLASWSVKRANPTETDLFVLDNALVVNQVPASEAYGTVIF